MADWIKCHACGLPHTPRPEGTCPRCGTLLVAPADPLPATAVAAVPAPRWAASTGFDERLRTERERLLFTLGTIFSGCVYFVLVITIVGAFYGVMIALFMLCAHALFLAHVRGNSIRLTERQLPDLYARVSAAATRLGLPEVPEVYVMQSHGALNAFASKLFSRKYVIIYSSLLDACEDVRQLDFVIGHEIGHLAAGHLKWNAFLLPWMAMPWAGPAYSRAREYTCDRCGLDVAGDLEQSIRGLAVLAAGGKYSGQVNIAEFQGQRAETGDFWMAVLELVSSHPYLCKRAAALQEYTAPGTVRPVSRNPFAYVLAPLFGMAAGPAGGLASIMVVVAIMGILAAIAIPNFIAFQERARAAALKSDWPPASRSR